MERVREKPKEEQREQEPESVQVTYDERQVSHARELEYFKRLLKAIKEDLALSERISSFIQRVDSGEPIAIAIEFSDTDDTQDQLPSVVKPQHQQLLDDQESNYMALCNLHDWLEDVRYEFMYARPKNKQDSEEWLEEWSKVMFDFAAIERKHVIYVQELLKSEPFSKLRTRKKSVVKIGNKLKDKKLAIWLVKKEKLRVYWKSLDEWANDIYDWAFENSITEPMLVYNFKETDEDFATLPDEEYREIFKILEQNKKGRIVKSSDNKLAIIFEY